MPSPGAERAEIGIIDQEGGVLRHDQRDAIDDEAAADRGDERVDADDGDEQTVGESEEKPDDYRRRESDRRRIALSDIGSDHGAQRIARRHRQVEAAGQDDECHADRHDSGRRPLRQHVEDVLCDRKAGLPMPTTATSSTKVRMMP